GTSRTSLPEKTGLVLGGGQEKRLSAWFLPLVLPVKRVKADRQILNPQSAIPNVSPSSHRCPNSPAESRDPSLYPPAERDPKTSGRSLCPSPAVRVPRIVAYSRVLPRLPRDATVCCLHPLRSNHLPVPTPARPLSLIQGIREERWYQRRFRSFGHPKSGPYRSPLF